MTIKHRRITPLRHCAALAGALAVAITPLQSRSPFYLVGVGPPTLRFDSAARGQVVPSEYCYNDSKPPVPAKVALPDSPAPAGTNAVIASTGIGKNADSTNTAANVAEPVIPYAENGQTSGADQSIVTPLTVLEFLQPLGGMPGTNGRGAAVLIPVKIDFTPPVRANNSSTAVYKRE